MPNIAIIVAAGQGRRFGGLKQFMPYQGRPLFLYSVATFNRCKTISTIVLAVPRTKIAYATRTVKGAGLDKVKTIVAGGRRRQDSVKNCLAAVSHTNGIVAVHDAVRPLVSPRMINKGIRLCQIHRAVVFGIPVSDTMKHVKNNIIIQTVPRDNVYTVQTPQFFKMTLLKQALEQVDDSREFTDEAALLESHGMKVHLFPGDPQNIKITTKKDLDLLDRML